MRREPDKRRCEVSISPTCMVMVVHPLCPLTDRHHQGRGEGEAGGLDTTRATPPEAHPHLIAAVAPGEGAAEEAVRMKKKTGMNLQPRKRRRAMVMMVMTMDLVTLLPLIDKTALTVLPD